MVFSIIHISCVSSSLTDWSTHFYMKTTHNTQRVHSLHLTSSEGERRASPLRLRIDTMRTTSLLLPSTGYPWLWVYLLQTSGGTPYPCVCVWTYLRSQSCCYGPRVYHASSTAKRKTKRQGQNAIAHACGRVCRWWDTYITPQSCQDCYRVYHASFNAKTRAKRHCACVWMGLQMVGHIYHTTIVPRLLSCILRFLRGKNKDKTPLRMRVDGFADGGTHISHHNRAKTAIVYITLRSMQKQGQMPLRMRVDGFADGGTHISNHNHANRAIMYITLHPRQKQRQNAIAHACGRVCRWWDTYLQPHSYFVLHVFVSFPRKPLFVCLTFRESFNFLYILTIVLHDWIF